jgi:small neutral amino acid transporter SnatA (MarC family)
LKISGKVGKIIDAKKLRIISGLSGLLLIYFGIKYGLHHLKHV